MRYAVVNNGIVINVVLIADLNNYLTTHQLIRSDTANVGDRLVGQNFNPPVEEKHPNWDLFNKVMQLDAAYNRMVNTTTNKQSVDRLEALAIALGVAGSDASADYNIIASLWNSMIDGVALLSRPNSIEILAWKNTAIASQMPFTFDAGGKMINA